MASVKKAKKQRQTDGLVLGLMIGFAIISITAGVLAFTWVRGFVLSWSLTALPGAPVDTGSGNVAANNDPNTPADPAAIDNQPAIQQAPVDMPDTWDGASRVNILVMGLDERDWEAGETPRTDTMVLVTVDPIAKTAGILSIPRDLWVSIPGFDYGKINTAYYMGELYQVPGGGPAMASETIEHFLGVHVHFYAQVDFHTFERIIDEVGGVVLDIKEPITIYPIGKPKVTLDVGRYKVGGDYALAYARTRYTSGGDFDRATRTQEVIMELRYQITRPDNFSNLISRAPAIYQEVSSGIRTNMTLQQGLQLAMLATEIHRSNIRQAIISPDVVTESVSPQGLKILIPIVDEIRVIRDEIFTTGGPVSPAAIASEKTVLVQQEQARISVQNGTQTAGLASKTGEYLRSIGLNVVEETNADGIYDSTTIIIYNGTPYTIEYLSQVMNIPTNRIFNRFDPNTQVDLAIVVGNDWVNNNPMP